MPPASAEVSTLAAKLMSILHDLLRQPPIDEARDLARQFLAWTFRLGLLLELEPALRESTPVKELLDEARGIVPIVMPGFLSVADKLEASLHQIGDLEWQQVSELRSALEFFEEYFGRHPEFGMQEIDDGLKERARYEGPAASVPKGLPHSHWWWVV